MRRLAALACVLTALVACLLFGTRAVDRPSPSVDPTTAATPDSSTVPEILRAQEPAQPVVATQSEVEPSASEREIVVPRSTSIEGTVLHADGRPAEGASVGLFAPAREEDSDASAYGPQPDVPNVHSDRCRLVRSWTKSDAHGRFRFDDPDPATWIVRAELGPLIGAATQPFVLAPHVSRTDLRIDLPPAATLAGRVILPVGRTMANLCLELRPRTKPTIAPWCPAPGSELLVERVVPAEDATYSFGPVAAGMYVVGLVVDAELESRGKPDPFEGTVLPVLELDLPPGPSERDIDLRGGFPAVIVFELHVEVFDPFDPARAFEASDPSELLVEAEKVDVPRDGRALVIRADAPTECGPLLPGSWRISARPRPGGPWTWQLAGSVWLEPAERSLFTRTLRIARTRMRIVDAESGDAKPRVIVIVRAEGGLFPGLISRSYTADDAGTIDLMLPPGDYSVWQPRRREDGMLDFEDARTPTSLVWTESGPSSAILRLPR